MHPNILFLFSMNHKPIKAGPLNVANKLFKINRLGIPLDGLHFHFSAGHLDLVLRLTARGLKASQVSKPFISLYSVRADT